MRIGKKALEVLKIIANISEQVILRNDYLYTKYIESDEVKVKNGSRDIIVNYNLPDDEIVLDNEIGLSNINDFLSVLNTYDDNAVISANGLTLVFKDKRKKGVYISQTTSTLPVKKELGDLLYQQGSEIVKFNLLQTEKELILKDLAPVNPEILSLKSEDDKLYLIANNETTGNECKIEISTDNVQMADGDFVFPNPNMLKVIANDDYKVTLKECVSGDTVLNMINFEAIGIKGLSYKSVQVVD